MSNENLTRLAGEVVSALSSTIDTLSNQGWGYDNSVGTDFFAAWDNLCDGVADDLRPHMGTDEDNSEADKRADDVENLIHPILSKIGVSKDQVSRVIQSAWSKIEME